AMQRICAFVVTAMVLASPAGAAGWVKFTDPKGHFTVEFPFGPTVLQSTEKAGDGRDTPVTWYTAVRDRVAMVVAVADFSGRNIDPQTALDDVTAGFSKNPDFIMESSQTDALD